MKPVRAQFILCLNQSANYGSWAVSARPSRPQSICIISLASHDDNLLPSLRVHALHRDESDPSGTRTGAEAVLRDIAGRCTNQPW
jgi:hypothetical protein